MKYSISKLAIGGILAAILFGSDVTAQSSDQSSRTFNYTGKSQTFKVPEGVTSLHVEVEGASGGSSAARDGSLYGYPGLGGRVEATIPVTPGEVLTLTVGGAGKDATAQSAGKGGFNGGAIGGFYATEYAGGGGGGASDIRRGNVAYENRIVVAGGGGASGYFGAGGNGGDLTGAEGYGADVNAGGGTQTNGGAGGSYTNMFHTGSGSFGQGGVGGKGKQGGGGGGGWYGGGAGTFGDGGGGSSYTISAAASVVHTQGAHKGNGRIKISWQKATVAVTDEAAARAINTPVVAAQALVKPFPNPTSGKFAVELNNFKSTKAEVIVMAQSGNAVEDRSVDIKNAKQLLNFDLSSEASGVYLVSVVTNKGVRTCRLVLDKQ